SLGQYNVAPALDFNRDSTLDVPYDFKDKKIDREPNISIDRNFNPFKTEVQKNIQFPYKREKTTDWESLYTDIEVPEPQISLKTDENQLFSDTIPANKTHQIHGKYIISAIKSGLIYINQNLAHQRILYEEYLENITVKEAMSQQLLFPLEIVFSKDDINLIKEIQSDIESTGFLFDKINKETLTIKGIPTTINESQVTIILEQLLDDIKNEIPEASFSQLDIMAKSLAKSMAIRTGTQLTLEEQENIVERLFSCKEPNHSPYGKPTFISIDIQDIDKKFGL
ncbi:MAG: DNA mismatch repair protein MutL, partial [Urechidicola sp.]